MAEASEPIVVWHPHSVARAERESRNGHRGAVVWFTGLSGSGKSTIANATERILFKQGCQTFLLDGDNVRHGLCATPKMLSQVHGQSFADRFGLGFAPEDREENIRRVGALAQLFSYSGAIVLTAFVSPYRRDRDRVRQWVQSQGQADEFIEVFVDTPIEVCESRDPKGLYKQAREGKIAHFTGISDPYEPPANPELVLSATTDTPDQLAMKVVSYLVKRGILSDVAR